MAAVPVTVVHMTYDQRDRVVALLGDLARQDYPMDALSVVILDDGSTDGTADAIGALVREVPYRLITLHREHSAHYLTAQRWNECLAAAPPTGVFVHVDDVRLRPDFIRHHVRWHADGVLRLVTGAKFEGKAETWELADCKRFSWMRRPISGPVKDVPYTWMWGASYGYSSRLRDLLTCPPHDLPFDQRMTGWGYHEIEFAYRATLVGAEMIYDPAVGVFHRNHAPRPALSYDHEVEVGTRANIAYLHAKHPYAPVR